MRIGTDAPTAPEPLEDTMEIATEALAITTLVAGEMTAQQARAAVAGMYPQACAFDAQHAQDGTGTLLGYTFQERPHPTARAGWITAAGTVSKGLEAYHSDARVILCLAFEEDRATTPAPAVEALATPADVTRTDDVKIRPDGRGKWSVERGTDTLGVIWDEGAMARGRFATWSPFAQTPGSLAGFFDDPATAVDAIVDMWPTSPEDIARETGADLAEVIEHADALVEEWVAEGRRVYRTAVRGAAAKLTSEAAATVRVHMGLPSARYAVPIGADERTWPRFHRHDAALRHAASYGLTAGAVLDTAPQWRTLQGVAAPFQLWGHEDANGKFHPSDDLTACAGRPVAITLTWNGSRWGQDSAGREIHLGGPAVKYWVAPGPVA
ncbi:hypothetical protein ACGFR8_07815 [Streptomyces brevispora]|uniref:hypothetical protein n=1 Tax=Streptomyces brevispora TaxID=887462 RepID=UPI00370FEC39